MERSIYKSVKNTLGVDDEYEVFDAMLITHINSVFDTLRDLGVGAPQGFMIEDDSAEWDDFIPPLDPNASTVKTYMYLKVRMLFDPPQLSWVMDAMKGQISELEFRMNVRAEHNIYLPPPAVTDYRIRSVWRNDV